MLVGLEGRHSPATGAVFGRAELGPFANYKNWNREPALLALEWSKRPDGSWWLFADVEPGQLRSHGVFVVWQNGNSTKPSSVFFVGRGSLRDEFARCHRDPIFRLRGLYVTWATVHDIRMLDSVAAYLYQKLAPMWGEAVFAPSMPVNLPVTA